MSHAALPRDSPTRRRAAFPAAFAVAIVLVAANLRPAVASVGPVLASVRHGLHLSAVEASLLTSVPVICFGALAPVGPALSRAAGMRRAVGALVACILVGLAVRVGPDTATLFTGTVLAAGGIAAGNVLLPALIKHNFAGHTGRVMGLYTTALTGSAAVAAGVTVPVSDALGGGWRGGLGIWAALAALALLVWLPCMREKEAVVARSPGHLAVVLRDPVAWAVTVYMGLQSLGFYSILEWLPTLYRDHGYSPATAGALLSLSAIVQTPVALVVPSLATRVRDQGVLVAGSVALTAIGFAGLLAAPTTAAYLWVVVLGLGQGAAFPIALTLILVRTRTTGVTTQLSAMAQSVGYLIAAAGPLLVGLLRGTSGGWALPLAVLLALLAPQLFTGLAAGRPRYVAEPDHPAADHPSATATTR